MDRQLTERMIGGAVLLVALVLIVPTILDGDRPASTSPGSAMEGTSTQPAGEVRTHTIHLNGGERSPPVPRVATDAAVEAGSPADEVSLESSPDMAPVPAPREIVKPPEAAVAIAAPVAQPEPVAPPAAPAKATQPVEPEEKAVAAGDWVVQLGSFAQRSNAERLAAEAGDAGVPIQVVAGTSQGKQVFRVRTEPVASRAEAAELAGRLASAGHKGQVTRR